VTQRVSVGEDSPVEANKAGVTVAYSRVHLTRLHSELIQAKTRLADLWAGNPEFDGVTGVFDAVTEVPDAATLQSLIQTHPALLRWTHEVEKAEALQSLADSEVYQPLALRAGLKRLEDENENTGVIGIGIPLPVFDRNQGRRAEAKYFLAQARQHQRRAEARLKTELVVTVQELNAVFAETMALKNEIIPQAEAVFQSSLTGYEQGKYDYLHVLDAQRQLFEQSARRIEVLLAYHRTKARLEALIGETMQSIVKNENS
jgi:cobalt-zinc-cadmium efflux system outer membrane protein